MAWIKKITDGMFPLTLVMLLLVSCSISYNFTGSSPIDYEKVKTISITDFPIKSSYVYAPLATKFNEELKDIYVRQTRLKLQRNNGDLEVEGEITGYNQYNEAVAADGFSSKVKLQITVNVRFVNNTNHNEDFEQQFSAFRTYDANQMLTAVQDDLIAQMVREIVDQVFNATVVNW